MSTKNLNFNMNLDETKNNDNNNNNTNNSIIIGISGNMGSGKDYVSLNFIFKQLTKKYPCLIMALADHFKIDIASFESTYEKVFAAKRDIETRVKLQRRGTEEGRCRPAKNGETKEKLAKIWIEVLENRMRLDNSRGIKIFIVNDVRFKNEAEWLRENPNAILIRLVAPNRTMARVFQEAEGDPEKMAKIIGHPSETELSDKECEYLFDYIVPNDFGQEKECQDKIQEILDRHFSIVKPWSSL